jgi:hypothetical protein
VEIRVKQNKTIKVMKVKEGLVGGRRGKEKGKKEGKIRKSNRRAEGNGSRGTAAAWQA